MFDEGTVNFFFVKDAIHNKGYGFGWGVGGFFLDRLVSDKNNDAEKGSDQEDSSCTKEKKFFTHLGMRTVNSILNIEHGLHKFKRKVRMFLNLFIKYFGL